MSAESEDMVVQFEGKNVLVVTSGAVKTEGWKKKDGKD